MKILEVFKKHLLYSLFAFAAIFSACDTEEEPQPNDDENQKDSTYLQTSGIIIFHEGGFGANNATIGKYEPEGQQYQPTVYRSTNGDFIGDVQQSAVFNEGILYSVLNGSNSIKIIDSVSMELNSTIEDELIDKPRDIAISGDKAYLSVWGPYNANFGLEESKVLEINLTSGAVTATIDTENGVGDLALLGNKLLVTRNYYGAYNHLTIINTDDNSIEKDIELPLSPNEIIIDDSGEVWLICGAGALLNVDINNGTISNNIDLSGAIYADAALYDESIYYLQNNRVNSFNITSQEINEGFGVSEVKTPYGFGIDPVYGDIYLGDALDYTEGEVSIYSLEGEELDRFTSGISPSQFAFEVEEVQFEEENSDENE